MTQGHLATRFLIRKPICKQAHLQPLPPKLAISLCVWPFTNPCHYLLPPVLFASSIWYSILRFHSHIAFLRSVRRLLVTANVPILVTLMMEAPRSSKSRFLQEPHGFTSQKTAFFILTAVRTSNLTKLVIFIYVNTLLLHRTASVYLVQVHEWGV
jgi:hypothetical protein